MAVKDVKLYYLKMLDQYCQIAEDLKDFEQGVKDGYVTEDQLQAAKDDVEALKTNVDRLAYILFLLELPNKKDKKEKYIKANKELVEFFEKLGASKQAVIDENTSILFHLRQELEKLTKAE